MSAREYVPTKDTAKMLRAALRCAFPETPMSVTCGRGTASAWIHVSWTDGPACPAVDTIARRYEGSRFNGMTDSYDRQPDALVAFPGEELPREVRYCCDGVNTQRTISPEAIAWAARLIAEEYDPTLEGQHVHLHGRTVWQPWNGGIESVARHVAYAEDLRGVDFAGSLATR